MGLSKIRFTQDMQQLGMGETWAALREFGMMLWADFLGPHWESDPERLHIRLQDWLSLSSVWGICSDLSHGSRCMARCWKARVNVARKKRRAKVGSERISMLVGQFSADGSAVDLGAMWRFSRVTWVSVFNLICTKDFPHWHVHELRNVFSASFELRLS